MSTCTLDTFLMLKFSKYHRKKSSFIKKRVYVVSGHFQFECRIQNDSFATSEDELLLVYSSESDIRIGGRRRNI